MNDSVELCLLTNTPSEVA